MLYNFSFPAFYGKGVRGAIFVKANLHKNLSALLKISNTHYFDRKQISSGLQQISGSNLTDLEFQLTMENIIDDCSVQHEFSFV